MGGSPKLKGARACEGPPWALNLTFGEWEPGPPSLPSPLTGKIVHGGHFHQVPPHDAQPLAASDDLQSLVGGARMSEWAGGEAARTRAPRGSQGRCPNESSWLTWAGVRPAISGVPVPGAKAGSSASMSKLR